MRDWIKLFETDFDHAEEARDNAVSARERSVQQTILAACHKAGIELDDESTPVVYDEADERSVLIRVAGALSLVQLESLKLLGANFVVNGSRTGYGVTIEFNAGKHLDPNIAAIR